MTTNIYKDLYEEEKARWALLLTEKGKAERQWNAERDDLKQRLRDLRTCLREELMDRHADRCDDCQGTGGEPESRDVLTSSGMSISHTEISGFSHWMNEPCETCLGVGFIASCVE